MILTRKWFDKIASGSKWYEFREATPYWQKRLEGRAYRRVTFQMGYARHAPRLTAECSGIQRRQMKGHDFYAIRIKQHSTKTQ